MSSRTALWLGSALFVGVITLSDHANASPVPLSQAVKIGKPARAATVTAESTSKGLAITIGNRHHILAVEAPQDVSVETVMLDGDAAVNVLRARGAAGEIVALFGGLRGDELLLSERADLHGDPGERTRTVIQSSQQNGHTQVVVGVRHEAVALCGGHEALFRRRAVDPGTLSLKESAAPGIEASDLREVQAIAAAPAGSVLNALDAVASSHVERSGPLTPTTPLALVDGKLETVWTSMGKGTAARGEFAILRWGGKGFPIERVVLVPPAAGAGLPSSLWLLADAVTLHVTVPADAKGPVEVPFPAPVDARCLAIVVDQARAPNESVAIAEAQVSTAIEREGGVERLVALLVQDDPRADDIATALGGLGRDAAARVAARYDELSERGKRRALRVLLRHMELDAARARVLNAARTDAALRDTALAGLRAAGEPGRLGLRELALDATETGDAAATWLGRETGEASALLKALGTDGGAARSALREALVGVARRESADFDAAVQAWLGDKASVSSRVALALVLSLTGQHADRAAMVAEPATAEVSTFEDRYRLAIALASSGPNAACDQWLDQAARTSNEWMMRRVAFEALHARDPSKGATLAAALASDAYPRVRAASFPSLVTTPERKLVEKSALEDGWPLVRTAAVRALAVTPEATPTLRKAIDDLSRRVRSAAIESLATLGDKDAWSLVKARLTAPGEWPEVHAAAIRFAGTLCIADAHEPLLFALRHSLRPDATEDDVHLGLEALRALHDLGGQADADALLVATRDGAPPGLTRVAKELPPSRCVAKTASLAP